MPNFLLLGDAHLKLAAPNRKDRIWETQKEKLECVYRIAERHKAIAIVQVGDLFNSPEPPNELAAELIALLRTVNGPSPLFTILGQHEMYMRTGLKRSPTRIIVEAGLAQLLSAQPFFIGNVALYGCHFGSSIPTPEPKIRGVERNVLVIHAAIYPDPLFSGDTSFTVPRKFLNGCKGFDLVVCGDYHGSFLHQLKNGRAIVNPGAMTRQTIRDVGNVPQVLIWDSDTSEITSVVLEGFEADPFEVKAGNAKRDDSLDKMLGALQGGGRESASFKDTLMKYLESHDIADGVRGEIESALEVAEA